MQEVIQHRQVGKYLTCLLKMQSLHLAFFFFGTTILKCWYNENERTVRCHNKMTKFVCPPQDGGERPHQHHSSGFHLETVFTLHSVAAVSSSYAV